MSRNADNIEFALLDEINGSEMNTRISCQKLELWEQTQSTPTMNSSMRGCSVSKIDVEKRAQPKKTFDISQFVHYIKNKALNFLGEKR